MAFELEINLLKLELCMTWQFQSGDSCQLLHITTTFIYTLNKVKIWNLYLILGRLSTVKITNNDITNCIAIHQYI